MLKMLGHIFVVIGLIMIVVLRVLAYNLTEGQTLFEYLPYWLLSIAFVFGGIGIQNNCE